MVNHVVLALLRFPATSGIYRCFVVYVGLGSFCVASSRDLTRFYLRYARLLPAMQGPALRVVFGVTTAPQFSAFDFCSPSTIEVYRLMMV